MEYFSLDIETTGLNQEDSEILEIALVYDNLKTKVDSSDLDEYIQNLPYINIYVKPENNIIKGDLVAISMNIEIINKILNLIKNGNDSENIILEKADNIAIKLKEFINKCLEKSSEEVVTINLAGKNLPTFDLKFCEKHIKDFSKHIKYRHRVIDPAILYFENEDNMLPDMKTCFKRAAFEKSVSHTALDDARDTIKLIRLKLA